MSIAVSVGFYSESEGFTDCSLAMSIALRCAVLPCLALQVYTPDHQRRKEFPTIHVPELPGRHGFGSRSG